MPRRDRRSRRRRLSSEEHLYGIGGGSTTFWTGRGVPLEEALEREREWLAWKRSAEAPEWLASDGREGDSPPYLEEAVSA